MKVTLILMAVLTAGVPADARTFKTITGTFIQLDGGNAVYTDDQWRAEFEAMKKLSQGDLSDVPTTPAPPTK